MSYHLYTTEGFILNSNSQGEADKQFSILTRDLGLVSAFAKSVRSEKTKLGGGLHDLSHTSVSLIRGKQKWKITSATCLENVYSSLKDDKEKLQAYTRILKLLEQLVVGEEMHLHFFDVVMSGVQYLKNKALTNESIISWESVLVLRILYNLGYFAKNELYAVLFDDMRWDSAVLDKASEVRSKLIKDINQSLQATQLS